MKYNCKCEKCNKITVVDTEVSKIGIQHGSTFVTAYGYLATNCIACDGRAYAVWRGFDGKRYPVIP